MRSIPDDMHLVSNVIGCDNGASDAFDRIATSHDELVAALEGLLDEIVEALKSLDSLAPAGDRLANQPAIKRARHILAKCKT